MLSLIPIRIFRFRRSCRPWTKSWTSWCTCRLPYRRVAISRNLEARVFSGYRCTFARRIGSGYTYEGGFENYTKSTSRRIITYYEVTGLENV